MLASPTETDQNKKSDREVDRDMTPMCHPAYPGDTNSIYLHLTNLNKENVLTSNVCNKICRFY